MPGLIEQLLAAGSDNAEVFCPNIRGAFTGGYRLQQDVEEFAKLVALLREHGPYHTALSIGIAAGGAERFMVEHVDIRQLVVMDDSKHPAHRFWKGAKEGDQLISNRKAIADKIPLHEFIGDSHSDKAADWLNGLDFKFNLVGIDGDHSPMGVKMDWELVKPYLAPGALVWFHDINVNEPGQTGARELWYELRKQHRPLLETRKRFGIGLIKVESNTL